MKIGLALAAGGVKGISHIATLKLLEEYNVKPEIITGSSAGSIIAGLYGLYGNSEKVYEKFSSAIDKFLPLFKKYYNKLNKSSGTWGILQRSLIPIEEYYPFFRYLFGRKKFSDCKIQIGVVTFDNENANSLLITEGYLVDAIMASSSVPGVFSPLWLAGVQNTDGGVLSPVPVSEAIKMGADFVIASTFSRTPIDYPKDQLELMFYIDTWKEIEIEYIDLDNANVVIYYRIPYEWFEFPKYEQIYQSALSYAYERREDFDPRNWR
ncbi:patatin-like phospholipase family protein [Thermosipho atlanticus]|uniref:NTE family protein n=1 Tax=Thermosipho atlanticus DSM 15807 TaxID=1123380 RepID=A0A1M5QZI5_9BACT|nr:patatin-like phospholipase family protein [Thermosipho atlanticus]SHH19502.1 NTE family protein [Thermosipho atlanticus DSM 15807]